MDTYFKIKTITEFGVPVLIIGLLILWGLFTLSKGWFKTKLMERMGYKYDEGLGKNVAYEFQPRWVKGDIKIHYREIDRLKYSKIKSYVKSKEIKYKE